MRTRKLLGAMLFAGGLFVQCLVQAHEALKIGSRLELLVDDHLVEELKGSVRFTLHRPTPKEVVLVHDQPWEGSGSGYHSVFRDGNLYRMYYRGWQLSIQDGKLVEPHPPVTCYAESRDGIHWKKPDLGLINFNSSKKNNIVLASGRIGRTTPDPRPRRGI